MIVALTESSTVVKFDFMRVLKTVVFAYGNDGLRYLDHSSVRVIGRWGKYGSRKYPPMFPTINDSALETLCGMGVLGICPGLT